MRIDIRGDIVPNGDKWVYDWLGLDGTCPRDVQEAIMRANGEPLDIYINSGGGDLFSGSEMYETLRSYPGKVRTHIIMAASAATLPACAGKSDITPTGMMMIHNVSSAARGDYHSMDKSSEVLQAANRAISTAYVLKTGKSESEILALMDRETWYTAQEAVEAGLVDGISQETVRLQAGTTGVLPLQAIEAIKAHVKNPFKAMIPVQANLNLLKLKGETL